MLFQFAHAAQLTSDKESLAMLRPNTREKRPRARTIPSSLRTATTILLLLAGLWTFPAQALAYHEQGRLHEAASWHSDEFKLNWGLGAIGADAAYARGLSGSGIRLGIVDTGVDLRHGEFAGKPHYALRLADPGCARETLPTDASDGCFLSDGDRASIEYNDLPPQALVALQELVTDGELTQDELTRYIDTLGARYSGHGTHVAGTILANRDGAGSHGVAFAASLSTVRSFSNTYNFLPPAFDSTRFIEPAPHGAFTAAYARLQGQNVRAINHSWGFSARLDTAEQLDSALQGIRSELGATLAQGSQGTGVLQVFAAGNARDQNPGESPQTAPFAGILATLPRVMPELEPYWLSVVNVNRSLGLETGSMRCGYSMDWCLAAPGTGVRSSTVGGEIDVEKLHDTDGEVNGFRTAADRPVFGYATYAGTSMAAPHVTGALGVLMERFPYLSNPQIRDVLLTTAQDLGEPGVDDVYGWGLVDLKKAIDGPGQLRVDTTVHMDRRAGGTIVWQGGARDDWRNDISGPGRLGKTGDGWLRLSGDNSFAGATLNGGILELDGHNRLTSDINVAGGLLRLNGTLQGTDLNVTGGSAHINGRQSDAITRVGAAGFLRGDGMLADTQVLGTIAPGSEQHPLKVNGDYQQGPGSTLIATAGKNPDTPALQISGQARLEASTLRLSPVPGVLTLGQHYRVLQADAGIEGDFTRIDHLGFSPFLSFTQTLDAHTLGIDVGRGLPLASAANTANQRATASAADRLAMPEPLAQRLTSLFPGQARHALDQLSGELHASTQSAVIENSQILRDAALAGSSRQGVWVQPLRQRGRLGGDRNAASASHQYSGVLVGADHDFEQGSRAGVLLSSGQVSVKSAGGKAALDSYQIGLHGGHARDAFGLYGGLTYGQHRIQTKRHIGFAGINESLSGDYRSQIRQAFVEGNYRLGQGAWDWQPFVQFASVHTRSDGFRERGTTSALKGRTADSVVNLTTGGVRLKVDMSRTSTGPSWLSLNASAAYTRASGDLTPAVDVAWQGASSMHITGAPLNSTALQLNLGAVARLTRSSSGSMNLSDQRGERSQERSVSAQYLFEF